MLIRLLDVVFAFTGLVLGFPVLVALTIIGLFDTGSPIFRQERVGRYKKPFTLVKFRTMKPDTASVASHLASASAITPFGGFLRKTKLDELPQLWNVLKGEMSLVGPRPVVDAELERYGNQVDYYLEAKPGVTGLWQVSGRNDVSYDTRVYLDAWYVKNWSLFNDIVILLKTVKVIFKKDGAY